MGFPPHPPAHGLVNGSVPEDTELGVEDKKREPHEFPTFDSQTISKPVSTVLYLPPLLSSLPLGFPEPLFSTGRPPLVTGTRLPDIDPVSLSFHKALHHFRPLTEDYATLPYACGFNWSELELPEDEVREWYAVAFRSRRKLGSDGGSLYEADKLAHEEAVSNGGLIMYWYGVPNPETGMNLATCIWQSRKHARVANSGPHHVRAMKLAAVSYETYTLERYRLSKVKGDKGIIVEDFDGVECGW
ncbi:hypothetical protein BU15DRAFT_85735 [Melanogaster broomeanus]|nr:hypothetical protein BU15DRAFT_85735 [Melanogaster broomeanus]